MFEDHKFLNEEKNEKLNLHDKLMFSDFSKKNFTFFFISVCRILKYFYFAFLANRAALRASFIAISMFILLCCSGFYTIGVYATDIFIDTKSDINPIFSSILLTIIQIAGNLIVMHLVDRIGRKILYITSSILSAAGMIWFAFYAKYLMQDHNYSWMGTASICFAIFVGNLGLAAAPFIVGIEIFPKKV